MRIKISYTSTKFNTFVISIINKLKIDQCTTLSDYLFKMFQINILLNEIFLIFVLVKSKSKQDKSGLRLGQ